MRFLRRAKRSAQLYLVLTGIGAAALIAAPVVAICQLLQPERQKKKQSEVTEHLKEKISEVAERAGNSFEEIAEGMGEAISPDGGQAWLREHKKLHNVSDEEWEENNEG